MMASFIVVFAFSFFMKWSKPLLIVVTLESVSACVLMMVLLQSGPSHVTFSIFILTFMVGESLIILASLYSASRILGEANLNLML